MISKKDTGSIKILARDARKPSQAFSHIDREFLPPSSTLLPLLRSIFHEISRLKTCRKDLMKCNAFTLKCYFYTFVFPQDISRLKIIKERIYILPCHHPLRSDRRAGANERGSCGIFCFPSQRAFPFPLSH